MNQNQPLTQESQLNQLMVEYASALYWMNSFIEEHDLDYDETWDKANQLYDDYFVTYDDKVGYKIIIHPIEDESGHYYIAKVLEFKGCVATGDTREEAHEAILEVLEGFIEDMREDGEKLPKPMA